MSVLGIRGLKFRTADIKNVVHIIASTSSMRKWPSGLHAVSRKWFDCAECHREHENHPLQQSCELVGTFACKKCKKCFRKDAAEFDESDEYCPHCDNHFIIEAVTPKPALQIEGEDARVDSRMLKDERIRGDAERSIFSLNEAADRLS
ncbi:hypothetical protein Egran_01753 [Elaphomyces granulatus]|uniref:CHY-type domain-containing protein n=1 Tax=Elaphomyces granulatus TaxID=519963 RepID=A0A232M243_9EURO|nr:hypothetical protein Egran_01753 [Elaphomyces granulatus]